jgi:uncharacterized membrane protein
MVGVKRSLLFRRPGSILLAADGNPGREEKAAHMSGGNDTDTGQHGCRRRVVRGAVILGLGIGGFFDGIVLHQVLQWHHMLTNVEPLTGMASFELNTLWDGLFHVFAYVCTLIGIALVWSAARLPSFRWSTKPLVGGLLVGWGTFNVAEGIVNHHILQIHHVRAGPNQPWWDLGFLVWGAIMLVGGLLLTRAGNRDSGRQTASDEH